MKVTTIAEIGINHAGDISLAKEMVKASALAGADIAKFQWYNPLKILGKDNPNIREAERAEFCESQHFELKKYCDRVGIEWCVSVFHPEQVERTETMGIKRYKVASRSVMDFRLLGEIALTKKPVILSTGLLVGHGDVSTSLITIRDIFANNHLTLMYCVCDYPTRPEKFDFTFMRGLRQFCDAIGFSSHCPSIYPTLYAVECGASVTENHVVINKNQPGCDVSSSLNFEQLREMIARIREGQCSDLSLLQPLSK